MVGKRGEQVGNGGRWRKEGRGVGEVAGARASTSAWPTRATSRRERGFTTLTKVSCEVEEGKRPAARGIWIDVLECEGRPRAGTPGRGGEVEC